VTGLRAQFRDTVEPNILELIRIYSPIVAVLRCFPSHADQLENSRLGRASASAPSDNPKSGNAMSKKPGIKTKLMMIASIFRFERYNQARDDFNHLDHEHQIVPANRREPRDNRCQVEIPIAQQVGELAQTRNNRHHPEGDMQNLVGLLGWAG
jgi:hypothetical protein